MNNIEIISIERNDLCDKKLITVLFICNHRKRIQNIITDEDFTKEYIIKYLQNINYENYEN